MAGDVIVLVVLVATLWQGGGAGGWHLLVGRPPTRWSLRSRGAGQARESSVWRLTFDKGQTEVGSNLKQ